MKHTGWGGLFSGGPSPIVSLLSLLSLGLLSGCATTPDGRAWATICAATPVTIGHTYSQAEVRAMNQVGGWALTVEEVNARCHP